MCDTLGQFGFVWLCMFPENIRGVLLDAVSLYQGKAAETTAMKQTSSRQLTVPRRTKTPQHHTQTHTPRDAQNFQP